MHVEVGGTLERRTILILFIAVMVLASIFLLYLVLSRLPWGSIGSGESVAIGVGLLITVVICVSISFRMAFADERRKNSIRILLVVGLIWGSVLFFYLGVRETWETGYPAPFSSPSIIGNFLFAISPILGLAAILALILILDEHFAEADLKDETDKRRLPTEDSP